MKHVLAALTVAGLACTLNAADLTGTVTLKGTPPAEKEITPLKDDPNCGKLVSGGTPKTTHYVVGAKGELANCVVIVKGVPGAKSTGASAPAVELDQKSCTYVPHILAVQTGQKVTVKNSDPVMHNVHTTPTTGAPEFNQAQMPGGADLNLTFDKPENFLRLKCDVHPWMFAYCTVVDHPYFAVTDKDGKFTIKNVPPGKYTVEAMHRKAGSATAEVEVKDSGGKADFTLEAK
jgi:plastocyanin